jgi:hypothetical protein
MANYFPLIANPVTQRIEELPAGDNLNLFNSNISSVVDIYAVGNIYANNFIGNITGNISVPGSNTQIIFNNNGIAGASANLTFNGAVLTIVGNLESSNANLGNIARSNTFIGNFSGNGALLTNLNAANLNGIAPLAAQVTASSQPNITSVGNLLTLTVTGNTLVNNLTATGNVIVANISTTGNVTTPNINVESLWVNSFFRTNIGSNSLFFGNVNLLHANVLDLGNTQHMRISGGNSGYVLTTNGAGNVSWEPASGAPGGSNTQVQFNTNGSFNGSPNFTFNSVTNTLNLAGHLVANTFQMGSGAYQFFTTEVYLSSTSSTTPEQVLYSVPASQVSSIDFVIISTDLTEGTRTSTKISATVLGTEVAYTEYAGIHINGGVGSFSVGYMPGNILNPPTITLMCSPDSANYTTHNMLITKYAAL